MYMPINGSFRVASGTDLTCIQEALSLFFLSLYPFICRTVHVPLLAHNYLQIYKDSSPPDSVLLKAQFECLISAVQYFNYLWSDRRFTCAQKTACIDVAA